MTARHGTRTRYNQGCDCGECKRAENDYQKQRRRDKNAQKLTPVTQFRQQDTGSSAKPLHCQLGPAEEGVIAEIKDLPTFANRQGLVQIALALARVLDTPSAVAQWPSAAHRLSETLDKLRKGVGNKNSRLASVQAMTGTRAG